LASFGQNLGRVGGAPVLRRRAACGGRCLGAACRRLGAPLASFGQIQNGVRSNIRSAGIVELAHRALALRPGAPLVALDRGEARDAIALAQRLRKQVSARAARSDEIDVRGSDPARELKTFRIGVGAGDLAGQGGDRTRAGGIVACRDAQAVAARVLRRPRLAGVRPWPGAGAGIAPIGLAAARVGHAPSFRAGAAGTVTLSSISRTVRCSRPANPAR
jgi:hypothetical protein